MGNVIFFLYMLEKTPNTSFPQAREDNERDKYNDRENIQFFYLHSLYCPYTKNLFAFVIFPIQCHQILSCIRDLSFYLHPILSLHHIPSFCMRKFVRRYQDFGCRNSIFLYFKQYQINVWTDKGLLLIFLLSCQSS